MMHVLENEACMEPNVAPSWMSDELDRKDFIYECQCVADLLDYLNPRSGEGLEKKPKFLMHLMKKLSCRLKARLTVDF